MKDEWMIHICESDAQTIEVLRMLCILKKLGLIKDYWWVYFSCEVRVRL